MWVSSFHSRKVQTACVSRIPVHLLPNSIAIASFTFSAASTKSALTVSASAILPACRARLCQRVLTTDTRCATQSCRRLFAGMRHLESLCCRRSPLETGGGHNAGRLRVGATRSSLESASDSSVSSSRLGCPLCVSLGQQAVGAAMDALLAELLPTILSADNVARAAAERRLQVCLCGSVLRARAA